MIERAMRPVVVIVFAEGFDDLAGVAEVEELGFVVSVAPGAS